MKYVLMFADSVENQQAWDKMPEATRMAAYEGINKWFEEHSKAGRIAGGAELLGPSSSTTVRFKNGKPVVTDGPFIEAKEYLAGYYTIEAPDLDGALAWAAKVPNAFYGSVEVRPVMEVPAAATA